MVIKYHYNELNEVDREVHAYNNKFIIYTYDAGGNLKDKTESAIIGTASNPVVPRVHSYIYDTNWKDKLTSYDGKAITYDQIGNPLTYDDYTYTWEEGRQLKSINKTNLSMEFKYNAEGIRT